MGTLGEKRKKKKKKKKRKKKGARSSQSGEDLMAKYCGEFESHSVKYRFRFLECSKRREWVIMNLRKTPHVDAVWKELEEDLIPSCIDMMEAYVSLQIYANVDPNTAKGLTFVKIEGVEYEDFHYDLALRLAKRGNWSFTKGKSHHDSVTGQGCI